MATTPVTLRFEQDSFKEREVQDIYYEFSQEVDTEGQLSGIPRGGKIHITTKALNDGNTDLTNWMFAKDLFKNIEIEYLETKSGKSMQKIEAEKCYCVGYEELWEEGVGHFEKICISCKNIKFGKVSFENEWK